MAYTRSYDEPDAPLDPMCRHLRSKSMYVVGDMQAEQAQTSGSGRCWCNCTQNVFGPDSQTVSRTACSSARTCYQGLL